MNNLCSFLLVLITLALFSTVLDYVRDSVLKMDVSRTYSEVIPAPPQRKVHKEEVIAEEDQ